MMNVLCFDTSGPHCSVALAVGERIFDHHEYLERRHNESLLGILDDLFAQADIPPGDTDLIGFVAGPGSFTGIRLGASVAQALALSSEARVVPLATHEIMYHAATLAHPKAAAIICSIKSRGQLYYVCEYQGGDLSHALELTDEYPNWATDSDECVLIGEQPPWWPENEQRRVDAPIDARQMVALALARHAAGESVEAELGLPKYVVGDSPWRKQQA